MYKILFLLMAVVVCAKVSNNNPDAHQLLRFKQNTVGPIGILTTSNGSPVEVNDTSTLNSDLINNANFMENMAHFVRERIPERVVHAKGAGAFGNFEVTHDITHICKAKLFDAVGKRTPVAVRFSPVVGERGSFDTSRDPKGFAIKFYTEEGNYDLVGLSTPVFPIKDPILFASLIHAFKRNPVNNLRDGNMLWDFITSRPESTNFFLAIFGDGGVPDGYRYMPGFGIHTFQVVNKTGEIYFIRFRIFPDAGVRNLFSDVAQRLAGIDPDYATRDLYNAIESGNYPSWTIGIQVLTTDDVKNAEFNVFDVTRILPEHKYPIHQVGRLVLDKNPNNYFADIEQLLYNPGNLVPGIVGAPDKLFQARQFAYRDAGHYRLGINFNNIPVNCPMRVRALNYLRDGRAPVNDNGGGAPNYFPNTLNGPVPYSDDNRVQLIQIIEDDSYNFDQSKDTYVNQMTEEERSRLVQNIAFSIRTTMPAIQDKAINLYAAVHPDLGNRIFQALRANATRMTEDC